MAVGVSAAQDGGWFDLDGREYSWRDGRLRPAGVVLVVRPEVVDPTTARLVCGRCGGTRSKNTSGKCRACYAAERWGGRPAKPPAPVCTDCGGRRSQFAAGTRCRKCWRAHQAAGRVWPVAPPPETIIPAPAICGRENYRAGPGPGASAGSSARSCRRAAQGRSPPPCRGRRVSARISREAGAGASGRGRDHRGAADSASG